MNTVMEIDAGNSFIKLRIKENEEIVARARIPSADCHQIADFTRGKDIGLVCLSNVSNPEITAFVSRFADSLNADLFVAKTLSVQAGVTCGYDNPSAMGVDRWLEVLAAYHQFRSSCVVVAAGSAVTVDMVSGAGVHLGGYIVPGLRMMREALFEGTQQVRPKEGKEALVSPGRNTSDAVNHGILLMVRALVNEALALMPEGSVKVVIAGGDAELIAGVLGEGCRVMPDLVLDGLVLAYRDSQDSAE